LDAAKPGVDQEKSLAAKGAPTRWKTAEQATGIANRVAGLSLSWSSYWRSFCIRYSVPMRDGKKKNGETTRHRREVEIGSLVLAVISNIDQLAKKSSERDVMREAAREKVRREHGIDPELRKYLLSGE
jgi:hypothetical protein